MKNILAFIFLLITCLFIGCGNNKKVIEANLGEAAAEQVVLLLAAQELGEGPVTSGIEELKKKLEILSGNTMTIQYVRLVRDSSSTEMFESLTNDSIDILASVFSDMDDLVPEVGIMTIPHIIRDHEHLLRIFQDERSRMINAKFEELGAILSDPWYMGARQFTSNTPINSWDDMKGLLVRSPPSDSFATFIEAFSSIAIRTSIRTAYETLKSGKAVAQENPLSIIESTKMYEVQKHLIITDHLITMFPVMINKKKYDSLTVEQQSWLDQAIRHGGEVCTELVHQEEIDLLEKFKNEYGMTVTYLDKEEAIQLLEDYYTKISKKFTSNIIAQIRAIE